MEKKRGSPSNHDKFLTKQNQINSHRVNISLSISLDLLNRIEKEMAGNKRSEKIVKCIEAGLANKEKLP
jgi:hypothetical protein